VDHQRVVVGEVAQLAVVAPGAEVGEEVVGSDDRLGLHGERRRGDAGDGPERLDEGVDLGLVLARGPQPLPEERDGVEAEALDALVGEEADDVGQLAEDVGVPPVEVPLPGVEGGPHPRRQLVVPREAAGCEVGEHLGQGRLVGVGKRPVREEVEVGAVVLVAGPGRLGPRVLAGHVVQARGRG
jgi:hypothetical protein